MRGYNKTLVLHQCKKVQLHTIVAYIIPFFKEKICNFFKVFGIVKTHFNLNIGTQGCTTYIAKHSKTHLTSDLEKYDKHKLIFYVRTINQFL